jgi:hypothetical protein
VRKQSEEEEEEKKDKAKFGKNIVTRKGKMFFLTFVGRS